LITYGLSGLGVPGRRFGFGEFIGAFRFLWAIRLFLTMGYSVGMNLGPQLTTEILRVSRAHGASEVRVFGSQARGEAGADSDIDLLVTLDAGRSLFDLIGLKQELEDSLGRRVDVVTPASLSPYMRQQVVAEAVMLVE
jgi:predicted nucleotidyltransferase